MAVLTVQKMTAEGIVPTYAAASAGGDKIPNNGNVLLKVKNSSASSITVNIAAQTACSHGFTHPVSTAVAAGVERIFGPFDTARFNDTNGQVAVTYSAVTTVTVAVIEA